MNNITKILIVEDDLYLQKFYDAILKNFGFEVIGKAINGEEAVKMFSQFTEKPKIILMDYRMPIKNGIEATKEILKLKIDMKIIFVSADVSVKNMALSIGAVQFLEKPFSATDLISSINSALKSKEEFPY